MNENDLRDCFAMFFGMGMVVAYKDSHMEKELADRAYVLADAMLKARTKEPEVEEGIVAVKPRKRSVK